MKYLKTNKKILLSALCISLLGLGACENDIDDLNDLNQSKEIPLQTVNAETQAVIDQLKIDAPDAVIAHRGSTFWAPEETEAAFRWARNMGADYLEIDIQKTSDGILLALHDNNLRRTSNVESIYPGRADYDLSKFTLKELRALDAGSWFNEDKPDNARLEFIDQKISTLKDVLLIAEGMKVKRDANRNPYYLKADGSETLDLNESTGEFVFVADEKDNGNRPGVYIETKEPWRFKDMEKTLAEVLEANGWLATKNPKTIATTPGKVAVANTKSRIILQTFSWQSCILLEKYLPNIPKCMLLWKGGYDNLTDDDADMIADVLNFCVDNNVHIVGPSIAGAPNKYDELTSPWMCEMYHRPGFVIHAYSFDTEDQLKKYNGDYYFEKLESRFDNPDRKLAGEWEGKIGRENFIDGGFTNLTDLSLQYQGRALPGVTAQSVMSDLGYGTFIGRK
ncbi:MAG: glycerophosphodiester phosphodiesterase family protein [Marinifilaceae bacterium]